MSAQGWINLLSFAWTSLHDFVYFGIYYVLTEKWHVIKGKQSTEKRLHMVERLLVTHIRQSKKHKELS